MYKLLLIITILFSTLNAKECKNEIFSVNSDKGTTISEFIDQLSDECNFSVIVTDAQARTILSSKMHKIHMKDVILDELLSFVLNENNLAYNLKNNILKISYVTTKTYHIDYISTERTSTSTTTVTLSSSTGGASTGGTSTGGGATGTSGGGANGESESGIQIDSTDSFEFWNNLESELHSILNRPEDKYEAKAPIINREAGMVTVSATDRQIKRLDKYIVQLEDKLHKQVLIDVQLLSIDLTDTKTTGVDWNQIYSLQNINLNANMDMSFAESPASTYSGSVAITSGSLTIKEIIKFLNEQGDVSSLSNPKILTLNNQPALISVGKQFFYKIQQSTTQNTVSGTSPTTQSDIVDSVFAGILLDITPEISRGGRITLKINPSISNTIDNITGTSSGRTIPPDLSRKQLSSVVTINDGERVILGGLIDNATDKTQSGIPILSQIPILGNAFKHTKTSKIVSELIIIITPHIVKREKELTLKSLGYGKLI